MNVVKEGTPQHQWRRRSVTAELPPRKHCGRGQRRGTWVEVSQCCGRKEVLERGTVAAADGGAGPARTEMRVIPSRGYRLLAAEGAPDTWTMRQAAAAAVARKGALLPLRAH